MLSMRVLAVSVHVKSLCLALVYSLLITSLSPFMVVRAEAEPGVDATPRVTSSPVEKKGRKRGGELLVRFRENASNEDKTAAAESRGGHRDKSLRGNSRVEKLKFPDGQDVDALAAELRLNPAVELVEPNYLIEKDEATPNDPRFSEQWALKNTGATGGQPSADLNAALAWETTTGSPTTVIAVIDSGIDFSHPDLKNNRWVNQAERANNRDDDGNDLKDDLYGWDWVTDTGTIRDEQGHGTIVAGIIAAQGNNGTGTTGVMWRASLMSLRVLDNTGTGDIADAVEAIDYAVEHGAQVINCSWGMDDESPFLKDAIDRAGKKGVVVVTSAGNDGRDIDATPYYPASFELSNLISVASTDQFDQLAPFSNYGAMHVTIAAPGTDILTTQMGGGYRTVTGTSASAPLVTGVAGLVKTSRPWLTAAGTRAAIIEGARRIAVLTGRVSSGAVASASGAINALRGPDNLPPGSGGSNGGNGNGNNGGGGNQEPLQLPPSGRGTGGTDTDGGFSVARPTQPTASSLGNMPNLDQLRKQQNTVVKPSGKIRANLPCTDCDPYGGGGGGSSYYPSNDPVFGTARTQPHNDTGEPGVDLGSQNFNWSLPLVGLKGRAGLDLSLTLSYNSLVWTQDGSYIKYNADHGSPAPGFHLGMPFIQQRYWNSEVGVEAYMMVSPSGGSVELRRVGASNVYESADSTYMQMVDNTTSAVVYAKDGTQYLFSLVNNEFRCTLIRDRNGNYISVQYDGYGRISTITDTLGRVINFNYGTDQNLSSISQSWGGVLHVWAYFYYGQVNMQPNFPGLNINGPNNSYQTVLTSVLLDDGTSYGFDYTPFGQVWKFTKYGPNSQALNATAYNLPGSAYVGMGAQSECPRFTERHDWAYNWNNNNEVITYYSAASDGSWGQVTMPDQTVYKELFYTSGWQKGLTYQSEVWTGSTRNKWTSTLWTQDNTGVPYKTNPRPYDISIYDEANNQRRTTIDYTAYGLPWNVKEYAADGQTVLRRRETQYRFDNEFISRHTLGVVWMEMVYERQDNGQEKLLSKLNFHHDWDYWNPGEYSNGQTPSVGFDAGSYGTPFFGRANVTGIYRYNMDAPDDPNQAVLVQRIGYNLAGEPFIIKDALGHATQISYADSFADNNNGRGTLAYPTTITDGDGYYSTTQYNYDTGAVSRTVDPKGATATMQYDGAGRIERITNQFNGAYTRYVYGVDGMGFQEFSTLKNGPTEAYNVTVFDGAGRVRAQGGDLPGSSGGYRAQFFLYDVMGRVSYQSNPAEINSVWAPTGDDAPNWTWTTQTYDWKGRPRLTTNPDNTTRENLYTGCGCAGGEQITSRDERGRRKKMTMDVLGRLKKVEELNWDQSVYATTNYTYDALDRLKEINQAGRTRSFIYDGHGRLYQRKTPEQGTTTYDYNLDDTVNWVQDARGSRQTYGYNNNRHLVKSISYNQVSGVADTTNVAFDYDQAGNRISMTDGLGSVSYDYNTISQLKEEIRTFTGVGSYKIAYDYEKGGQLSGIRHYNNVGGLNTQVNYVYDYMGRVTDVTGAGYAGVSSYASNLQYRAFGGLKALTYGNSTSGNPRQLSLLYDSRLRLSRWDVSNVLGYNYAYNNFSENTGRVTYAQNIYDSRLDRSFDYDQVGRVTSTHTGLEARWHIGAQPYSGSDGPYSQSREYDQWGNMTHRVGWGGWYGSGLDQQLSYNTNNQLTVNPANSASMQYDASGNLTNDGEQNYSYDARGQQTFASGTSLLPGLTQDYDGNGVRARKIESGTTTYYLRSSVLGGQVLAEITGSGGWQRGYVYLGTQQLAIQSNGVYWVHTDPVSKSQRVTNSAGTVTSRVEVDPWGGEVSYPWSDTSAFEPKNKYTNYERDGNRGDEAMLRRYEGKFHRFSQPDPYDGSYSLTDPQSFNRYAYVQNDPVNFTDPTGLFAYREAPDYSALWDLMRGRWELDRPLLMPEPPTTGGAEPLTPLDPGEPPAADPKCTFPGFDNLNSTQQALLNSISGSKGADYYNGLSDKLKASFLNLTGALSAASINMSGLALAGIEQDRLFFAAGTTAAFQASIQAGISSRTFLNDKPADSEHPGMSNFGARQNVTKNALQVGVGPQGGFVDIDYGNPKKPIGLIIHMGEVLQNKITKSKTDPFKVGQALGSKVTGYSCSK